MPDPTPPAVVPGLSEEQREALDIPVAQGTLSAYGQLDTLVGVVARIVAEERAAERERVLAEVERRIKADTRRTFTDDERRYRYRDLAIVRAMREEQP